jgi:hypothetical protein
MEAGGSDDGEDEDFDEEDELGLRFFVLHANHHLLTAFLLLLSLVHFCAI